MTLKKWINQAGVNLSNITIVAIIPESCRQRSLLDRSPSSIAHLINVTILEDTEWKRLGQETLTLYKVNNSQFCETEVENVFNFKHSNKMIIRLVDSTCRINFRPTTDFITCSEVSSYQEHVCETKFLRQNDVFKYKYTAQENAVRVKLMHLQDVLLNTIFKYVFESTNSEGNFTLQEDGIYNIQLSVVQNSGQLKPSGRFTYTIIKNCRHVKDSLEDWLHLSYFSPGHMNVLLTDNRIQPITYGNYEFISISPFQPPGVLAFLRMLTPDDVNANGFKKTDQTLWGYLAEAFGAAIRKEGNFS